MRLLRTGLVVAVAAASLAVTATAGAVVTKEPNGHAISLMLRPGARSTGQSAQSGGVLSAHSGPVLTSEAPYLIFWAPPGHRIDSSSEGLMEQYLTDVAAASGTTNDVYSVLAQYGAPYSQQFSSAQAVFDTDPYPTKQSGCPLAPGMTACVTDTSLQAEISSLIAGGTLPAPASTGPTPIFFMITPVDVNVCIGGGECVSNKFCAYHNYFAHRNGAVLYASVPFSVFASGPKGCQTDGNTSYETPVGPTGDQAYNVADDLSHELSETITDPLLNAWYAVNRYEVADLCEQYAPVADPHKAVSPFAYGPAFGDPSTGTLYDQIINGDEYYNQTEYSDAASGCAAGMTPLS